MGPAIDVPDALTRHVGVELGRADTRMSEQFLNDAQVGPTLEQMGRERVAQRVRADPGCPGRGPPHVLPLPTPAAARGARREARGTAARRAPARRGRGRAAARAGRRSSAVPVERDLAERHESFAIALADHAHERPIERQVLAIEPGCLADPQAGRVQQLEQRAVPDPLLVVGLVGVVAAGRVEQPRTSSTVSVSGRSRGWRGRSRCAATSLRIRPSPKQER